MASQTHQKGVELMRSYLLQLETIGFWRTRVDTYTDNAGTLVRHHFCGGEWTIAVTRPDQPQVTVRYSTRAEMPSVEQLVRDTVGELTPA